MTAIWAIVKRNAMTTDRCTGCTWCGCYIWMWAGAAMGPRSQNFITYRTYPAIRPILPLHCSLGMVRTLGIMFPGGIQLAIRTISRRVCRKWFSHKYLHPHPNSLYYPAGRNTIRIAISSWHRKTTTCMSTQERYVVNYWHTESYKGATKIKNEKQERQVPYPKQNPPPGTIPLYHITHIFIYAHNTARSTL